MKRKNKIGAGVKKPLVLLFAAFFVLVNNVQGSGQNLIISEIMYDPKGVDTGQSDWVELYNGGDSDIVLKKTNFGLIDEEELNMGTSGRYHNCHGLSEDITITSGKYIILASNTEDFSEDYDDITVNVRKVSFSLSSGGDTIRLSDDKCATFYATASYDDSWGGSDNGKTLELVSMDGGYGKNNWQESFIKGGTPGTEYSKYIAPEPVKPKIYPGGISITELFPNPFQSQFEEYIELYNGMSDDVDLLGWSLRDASKTGKYVFAESVALKARKYLAIFKKDFKFALNNSGNESVTLFDPNGKEVFKSSYDGSKKNVSYNFNGSRWRWSKFLTPGAENIFNNEPYGKLKIDKDVFTNVYADFSVSTGDIDGDKIKVIWNFGDGHKSYLAKTRHKFSKTGIYDGSVKLSDGSEDVIKNFKVEVKKFPHPEIKIIAINANPAGADAGVEYITVQNKSKKKINLKGWSIATGTKKIINHTIRKDVIIKSKKEKQITNEISSFTLNNTKAKIQLRYPDGKVAYEVKYKTPNKTISEGEEYIKIKGGWEWVGAKKSSVISHQPASTREDDRSSTRGGSSNTETDEVIPDQTSLSSGHLSSSEERMTWKKTLEENKLLTISNDDVKIELLKSQPRVLGAETVREINGIYYLTPTVPEHKHYAVTFVANSLSMFNSFLNSFINSVL